MAIKDKNNMSFLDHLEDLRRHLIRIISAVIIVSSVVFVYSSLIFKYIIFAPLESATFPTYRLFCDVSNYFGVVTTFCNKTMPLILQNRSMSGQFSTDIWTSILGGIIISFPYIIYELWRFISPALRKEERRHAKSFIIISSLLFFLGVLFGYYIITPLSINFLANYSISELVQNQIDISSYISLVRSSALGCGIVFELPIIMYFLTKIGLITPEILVKYRKYSLIVVLIIAAIITPPDVVSQIIVSIPILILYEISIFISKIVVRSEKRKEEKKTV